jgi:hypothetical protein
MKKIILIIIIAAVSIFEAIQENKPNKSDSFSPNKTSHFEKDNSFSQGKRGNGKTLKAGFESRKSDFQIQDGGIVKKILPDDLKGSRHQKFIIKSKTGHTVLVAHNIDLAPRINDLREGDRLEFYGEYEWNPRGGVVHWTHHDPKRRHISGWLKHNGKTYQ